MKPTHAFYLLLIFLNCIAVRKSSEKLERIIPQKETVHEFETSLVGTKIDRDSKSPMSKQEIKNWEEVFTRTNNKENFNLEFFNTTDPKKILEFEIEEKQQYYPLLTFLNGLSLFLIPTFVDYKITVKASLQQPKKEKPLTFTASEEMRLYQGIYFLVLTPFFFPELKLNEMRKDCAKKIMTQMEAELTQQIKL